MALWGISTTTETSANAFNRPKHLSEADRNRTPHNCFADGRGWVYRSYGTKTHGGLSSSFYDEVLVTISGLGTAGAGANTRGLAAPTPTAVFFADPNNASPVSIGAGGTSGIGTGVVGEVHVVYNELVYVSAGATIGIKQVNAAGVVTAATSGDIVATASSVGKAIPVNVPSSTSGSDRNLKVNFNGQITNRVVFRFTAPSALSGIGSFLSINTTRGIVGTGTDLTNVGIITTLDGVIKNVGGNGSAASVGIGTTTLKIKA
jgi:hypothetical protein